MTRSIANNTEDLEQVLEGLDKIEDIARCYFGGWPYTEEEQKILNALSEARSSVEHRIESPK